MTLFVALPLLGGLIGYTLAPTDQIQESTMPEQELKQTDDWENTLSKVVYVEQPFPSKLKTIVEKYDEGKRPSSIGEVVFSYALADLNGNGDSEIMVCEEGGGVGMDGPVCDVGI